MLLRRRRGSGSRRGGTCEPSRPAGPAGERTGDDVRDACRVRRRRDPPVDSRRRPRGSSRKAPASGPPGAVGTDSAERARACSGRGCAAVGKQPLEDAVDPVADLRPWSGSSWSAAGSARRTRRMVSRTAVVRLDVRAAEPIDRLLRIARRRRASRAAATSASSRAPRCPRPSGRGRTSAWIGSVSWNSSTSSARESLLKVPPHRRMLAEEVSRESQQVLEAAPGRARAATSR